MEVCVDAEKESDTAKLGHKSCSIVLYSIEVVLNTRINLPYATMQQNNNSATVVFGIIIIRNTFVLWCLSMFIHCCKKCLNTG